MTRLLSLLGLGVLLLACTRGGTAGAGGPVADAHASTRGERPMAAHDPKSEDGGAKGAGLGLPTEVREWRLYDNGLRCVTFPCPSWTAESKEETRQCTSVDLSPLHLSKEREAEVHQQIYRGEWIVRGRIVEGPRGPGGPGKVMQVLALVKQVPAKEPPKDAR